MTRVDASSVLFAPFVSLPFPVAMAEFTIVPACVTRAVSTIDRSTPGPSVPSEHSRSAGVTVQDPFTGCVTARNVTPLGAASVTTTSCAWFGPSFRTSSVYVISA